MKPIDRLALYIKEKKISLNGFDKSIGASNGYIGKQIKNSASIGLDRIQTIASVYADLNLNWLITGAGNMLINEMSKRAPPTKVECKKCDSLRKDLFTSEKIAKNLERELETTRELITLLKVKASTKDKTEKREAS